MQAPYAQQEPSNTEKSIALKTEQGWWITTRKELNMGSEMGTKVAHPLFYAGSSI
jgi:hypothetical protein